MHASCCILDVEMKELKDNAHELFDFGAIQRLTHLTPVGVLYGLLKALMATTWAALLTLLGAPLRCRVCGCVWGVILRKAPVLKRFGLSCTITVRLLYVNSHASPQQEACERAGF